MENAEMLLFVVSRDSRSDVEGMETKESAATIATQNNLSIVTGTNRRTAERLSSGTEDTYPLLFVSAPAKDYCDKIQTFKGS